MKRFAVLFALLLLLVSVRADAGPFSFLPGGVGGPFFTANFTTLGPGKVSAATILSTTGLTFKRASVSTCQTSASTLDSTLLTDEACIGSQNGTDFGLVMQPPDYQLLGNVGDNAPRDLNVWWSAGTCATVTSNAAAGPDGVSSATYVSCASGTYTPYYNTGFGIGADRAMSAWMQPITGGGMQLTHRDGADCNFTTGVAVNSSSGSSWRRVNLVGLANSAYLVPSDQRNLSCISGGVAAFATSMNVDFVMMSGGLYPGEAIAQGRTTRYDDTLEHGSASSLFVGGRLRLLTSFRPKHPSSDVIYGMSGANLQQVTEFYLFSYSGGGGAYAKGEVFIDASTLKIKAKDNAGTTYTSTNALTWARFDLVDIFVEVGAGASSLAKYRVNGGAWSDLGSGTALTFTPPASTAYFFTTRLRGVRQASFQAFPVQQAVAMCSLASPRSNSMEQAEVLTDMAPCS